MYQEQSKTGADISVTEARFIGKVGANILPETVAFLFLSYFEGHDTPKAASTVLELLQSQAAVPLPCADPAVLTLAQGGRRPGLCIMFPSDMA